MFVDSEAAKLEPRLSMYERSPSIRVRILFLSSSVHDALG